MARNGKPEARSNGSSATSRVVLDQAARVTGSAGIIARVAEEVSEGAGLQLSSLDSALNGLNEMSASLRETATQADSLAGSAEELSSSVNEMAASIEQVTAN